MKRDQVTIRTPCGADWNAMEPRRNARHCGACDRLVHDLSSMSESDAEQLLKSTPESLCVRYLYDETGKIWFSPAPTLVPRERLNRKRGLALSLLVAAPLLMQACGGADPNGGWPNGGSSSGGSSNGGSTQNGVGGLRIDPGSDAGAGIGGDASTNVGGDANAGQAGDTEAGEAGEAGATTQK